MKVSLDWLNERVNIADIQLSDFATGMTMSGTKTEEIIVYDRPKSKLTIGKIVSLEKHPNADNLQKLSIDIGTKKLSILTAAKNVKEGIYVVVALDGCELADGTVIQTTKMRGELSEGMLVSYAELGFPENVIPKEDQNGVLVLDQEYILGDSFFKALNASRPVVDFELTYNRPDCLSIMGISYEAAATFKRKRKYFSKYGGAFNRDFKISYDEDICQEYLLLELNDITIKPSPVWLKIRLMMIGVRPINNLVDLTNYVLYELGQPVHAFDADKLPTREISVRLAHDGEKIQTIDHKLRSLTPEDIVITSDNQPVALAGVMGGVETEISEQTTHAIIEIANFSKEHIQKTSKRFGLRSNASSRFEKGINLQRATQTIARMIECCNDFEISQSNFVVYGEPQEEDNAHILLDVKRANETIGMDISAQEMIEIFTRLEIEATGRDVLQCKVPSFRKDLMKEIDLIEEIARIFGYNNIISKNPKSADGTELPKRFVVRHKIREILWACGFDEMLNYSFVSPGSVKDLHISKKPIEVRNPLGEDFSIMRPSLLVSALDVIRNNERNKIEDVQYFEMGNVFFEESKESQKEMLSIAAYGDQVDFYSLKGVIEALFKELQIEGIHFERNEDHELYHLGKSANIFLGDKYLGTFGECSLYIKKEMELLNNVYLAELELEEIVGLQKSETKYESFSRLPSITIDLSLVVDQSITNKQLVDAIWEKGGELLRSVKLIDVYEDAKLGVNKKSLTYSMVFTSSDHTLTQQEVDPYYDRILKNVMEKTDARRRA